MSKKLDKFLNFIMKVVQISSVIARVVGRVGNTIFWVVKGQQKYARGTYRDTKRSNAQERWSVIYNEVDMAFKELTDEQRKLWRKYAPDHQNEYSYFMKTNLDRRKQGLSIIYIPLQEGGS